MTRKQGLSLAGLGLVVCVASYQGVDPIKDGLDAYEDIRAVQEFRAVEAKRDSLYQRILGGGISIPNVIQTVYENPQIVDEYFEVLARRDSLRETPQIKEPLRDLYTEGNFLLPIILLISGLGIASTFIGVNHALRGETE